MSASHTPLPLRQQKSPKQPPLPSDLKAAAPFLDGAREIEPVLLTDISKRYDRRAQRLELLSKKAGEDGGQYLDFLRNMVLAQKEILHENPLREKDIIEIKSWFKAEDFPSQAVFEKENFLQEQFKLLYQKIVSYLPEGSHSKFEKLAKDKVFFAKQSWHLLNGQFDQCEASFAVPLWAALSLCWAQAAQSYITHLKEEQASIPSHAGCPCCGTPAVADMVMTGTQEGLRYEQCALCETRWHKVRSICPECFASEHLDYWSLESDADPKKIAIEIESCGDCKTYSKIFRLDRDPHHELCGDDLASIMLDALVEEKGFSRRTLNPFALPFPA